MTKKTHAELVAQARTEGEQILKQIDTVEGVGASAHGSAYYDYMAQRNPADTIEALDRIAEGNQCYVLAGVAAASVYVEQALTEQKDLSEFSVQIGMGKFGTVHVLTERERTYQIGDRKTTKHGVTTVTLATDGMEGGKGALKALRDDISKRAGDLWGSVESDTAE